MVIYIKSKARQKDVMYHTLPSIVRPSAATPRFVSVNATLDLVQRTVDRDCAANLVTPTQLRGSTLHVPISHLPTSNPAAQHLIDIIRSRLTGKVLFGQIDLSASGITLHVDLSSQRFLVRGNMSRIM